MYKKSLEIDKKLGRQEGMAINYGNLGLIYKEKGQKDKAHEYWEKALEIFERIGIPHEAARVRKWLDELD